MDSVRGLIRKIDAWQRHNRVAGAAYAVSKKFSDDQANLLVVALGWYGFLAIYPLLLVVVTVLGFIGVSSLGHSLVNTLHQFPVIGSQFNPGQAGGNLHGSVPALVIGVAGLLYGAQGVTQNAEQAMSEVWNIPQVERPGFGVRLARSLVALVIIGGAFVVNAFVGSVAAGYGHGFLLRALIILVLLVFNVGFYIAAFRVLTAGEVETRSLIPGATLGGIGFTLLITVGAGLVQHQLRHSTATYGAFASVIGVVAFLLLLAKLSIYAAELNPVLARNLWPRAFPMCEPTVADNQVLHDLAHEERRRPDQRIGVGFEPRSAEEAAIDARQDDDAQQPELDEEHHDEARASTAQE